MAQNPKLAHGSIGIGHKNKRAPVKLVVFDLSSSPYVEVSAVYMFGELHEELAGRGITLRLSNATGAVRDLLRRAEMEKLFGALGPKVTAESIVENGSPRNNLERIKLEANDHQADW